MFAGKKSAQIREILISESAWEEMTCLFAPSLADFLGALVGASFPHIEKYGLDFAMVAAFIAIVVPQIKSQACTVAAVVAAVSGVLLVVLPYSLGIVVASVLGVLAGLCVDLAEERKQMAKTESDMPLVEAMENE